MPCRGSRGQRSIPIHARAWSPRSDSRHSPQYLPGYKPDRIRAQRPGKPPALQGWHGCRKESVGARCFEVLNRDWTNECINICGDIGYGDTRAQCPGAISRKGKAPAGRASFSTIASGRDRSVLSVGMALISPRVYECRAEEKISATGPISTISPAYIT